MKPKASLLLTAILAALFACAAPLHAQNLGKIMKNARTVAAGVSLKNEGGKTTIHYQGKDVWTGVTSGKAFARSKVIEGKEYVAVFDGNKVLWQNVAGAAQKVQ